ncbi:MAG: radical SAM protein [Myxococcales bacterium]|nr:radical SAM protein [Myxococcales bacterium]
MTGLLDVILLYDCNLACDYCTITPAMRARALPTAAVVRELRAGRADGYDRVQFTGGEPTTRGDLLGLIKTARALGYVGVRVQSNGLVLGQGGNAARLIAAGCDDVHVSIHTHDAAAYDALTRAPGGHAQMVAGLDALVATGVAVTADVIIKTDTAPRLADAVAWLAARGVGAIDLWFVSLTDGNRANLASMPRMTEAMPHVAAALAVGRAQGLRMRSLHIPRCLLGAERAHAFDPGADRVKVVSPDAVFELAHSKLTGQHHAPACDGCPDRAICPGVRADYLARYGDAELAAARGQAPTRRSLPLA